MIAEFSVWKPKTKPKAVLVLTPPSQSDGRSDVKDLFWQNFAKDNNLAIVGCYFRDEIPTGIEEYADAIKGGKALLSYLAEHFGIPTPPVLLWGFSAGGQFNYEFACKYPEHTLAFVVNKGGIYYTALAPSATRNVPGLFIVGAQDAKWRRDIVTGICGVNNAAGAQWSLVEEPYTGHSYGDSRHLGTAFFEEVLGGL